MKIAEPRGRRSRAEREALAQTSALPAARAQARAQALLNARTAPFPLKKIGKVPPSWRKTADLFFFNSLVVQVWLGQLHRYSVVQYAERSEANARPMQTGHAWLSFSELFEPLPPIQLVRLFENLLRFANYDGCPAARAFFLGYAPLAFEHDDSGEYIGPGVWARGTGSNKAVVRVRRTLERWCDWLEALAHFQTHELLHPESAHRAVDKTLIFLWPLFRRHNWRYLDLLAVLRSLTERGNTFPCQSEKELAAYCGKVLGLYKVEPAAKDALPAGLAVAHRLFKFLPAIR